MRARVLMLVAVSVLAFSISAASAQANLQALLAARLAMKPAVPIGVKPAGRYQNAEKAGCGFRATWLNPLPRQELG